MSSPRGSCQRVPARMASRWRRCPWNPLVKQSLSSCAIVCALPYAREASAKTQSVGASMLMRKSAWQISVLGIAAAATYLTAGASPVNAQASAPPITQTISRNASLGVQPGQGASQATGTAPQQGTAGNAQQSSPRRQITLQDAFMLAERQNLDLAASRLQRAVAQAGIRIAGERPNPTVSFSATRDTPH